VRLRPETVPPPVFSTVPLIGYVRVLLPTLTIGVPQLLVALIAQVLKVPNKIDFNEAVLGELPDDTLANMTVLKQGATPPSTLLRSNPPSWNCSAGTTPPGNPAKPGPLTLNPVPGA